MNAFTLGDYKNATIIANDKITGFEGQVIGHADYITGCDQYLVQPIIRDGKVDDAKWYDEGRLAVNLEKSKGYKQDVLSDKGNGADLPAPIK